MSPSTCCLGPTPSALPTVRVLTPKRRRKTHLLLPLTKARARPRVSPKARERPAAHPCQVPCKVNGAPYRLVNQFALITISATDAPKRQQVESAQRGSMCATDPRVGRSTPPRIILAPNDYLHPPLQGHPSRNFSQLSLLRAVQGLLPVFAHLVCARVLELTTIFPRPFAAQF